MKKLFVLSSLFVLLILCGCEQKPREIAVQSCYCSDEKWDCWFDDGKTNWVCWKTMDIKVPFDVSLQLDKVDNLNDLSNMFSWTNFDLSKFFMWSPLNVYEWDFTINWSKITTKNDCGNEKYGWKIYDVSLDLTYFDWKSATSWEINKYLIENRLNRLESFFKWDNTQWLILHPWDKIILRFIWLLSQNWVGTALNDKISLEYVCENEQTLYRLNNEKFEWNSMRWKFTYYYSLDKWFGWNDKQNIEGNSYTTLEGLMWRINNEFYKRYGSYSEWTYMLDHFVNFMPSSYQDNYIVVVLSDFLFQLSPSDKKIIKNKYCSNWNNYCNDDLYEFNAWNISSKYIDWYFYKNVFTKYIFDNIPSINNLCKLSDSWDKTIVYLLWVNAISWLSNQDKIKDFYSNYLLKNCNVYYK